MSATADQELAELRGANEELLRERDAALAALAQRNTEYGERIEYQAATIDVLKAMSASPGDPQPVFDLIVERARDLCDAYGATVYEFDGTLIHYRAATGVSDDASVRAQVAAVYPIPPTRYSGPGRAILDRRIIRIDDMESDAGLHPILRHQTAKSAVFLPLLRGDVALGALALGSRERGGFSDTQIQLLQTFAEQAVIAMRSAETYRSLHEALEQQTATAGVLAAINASPGNLKPVFDTMLDKALCLCDAAFGNLATFDGKKFEVVATSYGGAKYLPSFTTIGPEPGSALGRVANGERVVQILDAADTDAYRQRVPSRVGIVERLGARTAIWVALHKDNTVLGVFVIFRREVRPFTEKQIALLQTFAAQAVIAMENARLLNETREALEQQTATAEVLQAINASPADLVPVFDAILEKAHSLCGATLGSLQIYDGDYIRFVAVRGAPEALLSILRKGIPRPTTPAIPLDQTSQVADSAELLARNPDSESLRAIVELGQVRTQLHVPLQRDGVVIGRIAAARREVRLFTDRQIALLENFAAQAVIAMENARLLTEQREALEQQTATAEVLQVINASPGKLAPVFDAILEKAHEVCGATMGSLGLFDDDVLYGVATRGLSPTSVAALSQARSPRPGGPAEQFRAGKRFIEIPDLRVMKDELSQTIAAEDNIRTVLFVPLRKDKALLGWITANRTEIRPFSEKQISLLEGFAAQAVIAMENARLLTETREALEQQTATTEVLQVINTNPGNLTPVFEAMVEKAMRLCGAAFGSFYTYDGEQFHSAAQRGVPAAYAEFRAHNPPRPLPGGPRTRALEAGRTHQVIDLKAEKLEGNPGARAMVELGGIRTMVSAPLCKGEALLGLITVYRQEVRAFSEKQIAVLENFAAQAVIAMENARLLNEVRQRQEELRITFENMGDGVAMFDETQRLVAWNGKFQEIYDLPAALLGQHRTYEEYLRFLARRGDFGAEVDTAEQIHELVASAGQPYGYERTRPDGRVIEIRRNPVPNGGFVLIFSDITERKRSEVEIRAARDAAETAYRDLKAAQASLIQAEKMASLGQLTAGIAHEIKNPLNFVNNFAELSGDMLDELNEAMANNRQAEVDELKETLKGNLAKIAEHGRRADNIVKGMLEHSRGSSGERRQVELNALVDEALNLAYHGARAQDQSFNVTLQQEFGEGIAPITLAPQDVTRVLLNLFSNGFYAARERQRTEALPGFEPTLTVTTRELDGAVEIRVRDNGIGIPSEIKDRLFQPFFTTKPPGEGTGLGLSMSYDIITQQHGGSISVDSKVSEYSEFTVRLPRSP